MPDLQPRKAPRDRHQTTSDPRSCGRGCRRARRPQPLAKAVRGLSDRSGRLAVHRADHPAAARHQHLSAVLGDRAVASPTTAPTGRTSRSRTSASTTTSASSTDPDIWIAMQTTAHFVFWTIAAADADRLRARLSDRPQVPRPCLLDHHHPGADDAVAGRGRQFLALPLRAADRALRLRRLVRLRHSADRDPDAEQRVAGALGDHHRRYLDVDALRDADLPRRAALDPRLHLRGGRGRPRLATGGSSGRSRCRWRCPSSCWRCCSAASRTSRCSTWSTC